MDDNKRKKVIYKLSRSLRCKFNVLKRLSNEQTAYINHTIHKSSFLKACPGSGKTEVIGIKAAFEIRKWKYKYGGLAVITFTNSAARELSNRIKKFADLTVGLHPHFIGTFDSWLHNFVLHPYCHYLTKYEGKDGDKSMRIIEDDNDAGFLSNYKVSLFRDKKSVPIRATEYHFKYGGELVGHTRITESIFKDGIKDEERKLLKENKVKFIKAGFATYADAEMLCETIFNKFPFLKAKFSERFPVIIVDECQDLSEEQISILEILRSAGTHLHFVGDLNQSIYDFRKVDPAQIQGYINSKKLITLDLTNNYRSCQPIVDTSDLIIGNKGSNVANTATLSATPCILWQYTPETFPHLPKKFEDFIKSHSIPLDECAILARGRSTLQALRTQTDKNKYSKSELFAIALDCWYKVNRNTEDLQNAIFYLGRVICLLAFEGKGSIKNLYCPEAYTPIEWRILLKRTLNSAIALYPFEENGQQILWKNWIPKLKNFLEAFWNSFEGRNKEYMDIAAKIKSPDKQRDNPVSNISLASGIHNLMRTTTIHSVKGQTLQAVLLVSHPDKKSAGGHFSHWIREGNFTEEHVRFAYVACSRPKHLLVVATPKLSASELAKFKKLGFNTP